MNMKVGDKVWWSHAWGTYPYEIATIKTIECHCENKSGNMVDSVDWDKCTDRSVIVTFSDRNNWAYGFQLKPLESEIAPIVRYN